jgi:hypothetical protein
MRRFNSFHFPAGLTYFLLGISGAHCSADIIISEIFYNQAGPDNAEFVEIHNTGTDMVDISGYHFDNGIVASFPANSFIEGGGYRVLVWNQGQFMSAYPGVPVAGTYVDEAPIDPLEVGALMGSGERVTLRDATGDRVFSVSYGDDPLQNWPPLADGGGYSLVPYRSISAQDPDEATYWRHSINAGGSPGMGESDPGLPPIYVNEIRTRDGLLSNDSVELYNPNPDPVDIGGWYLSDNVSAIDGVGAGRKKYRIPNGTMIQGNSYRLYSEATMGFGISSRGERLFLYSGNAGGQLTGYVHGFYFGASADGISFGRHVNDDGIEQLVPQTSLTLGTANSGPRIGPIAISEVMYNQLNSIEYIEFQNTSPTPVALFRNTDAWRIENAVTFQFPANQTIAAGEIFLVMNTNLTVFTTAHNVPAGVKIFGPFAGSLSNNGEKILLGRPERLNDAAPLEISYIQEEALSYGVNGLWPSSPDDSGNSLTRRDLNTYGDESPNWRASLENGGSPGWNTIYTGEVVYVNEALTHTDFPSVDVIELYNPNPDAVDIGHWYLSDSRSNPRQYQLPPGTMITANGFWCVNEDNDANPLTAAPAGYFGNDFSLSSRGEEVYLSSATADGLLSGYQHGFSFNASANGVSFGRYVDSLNEEHFTAQQGITIAQNRNVPNPAGALNDPPLIGPLSITEIYYRNAPGEIEFVELQNIFSVPVNLYDDTPIGSGGQPTNTWTVSGIDFTFPVPTPTIAANARVILLPFGSDVAGFRSSNNVPAQVTIYGGTQGYTGALNNGGERITLIRPDKPDLIQPGNVIVVPRIDVDTVRYDDDAPWPNVGESGGRSIERIDVNVFGDDVINWRTSNPAGGTPGIQNSTGTVYSVWALENYTVEERETPELTGPDDDFNMDGFSNIEVYAAGFDPRTSPAPSLLSKHHIMNSGGQDYLVLEHRRRIDATDLVWSYLRTDDLFGTWEAADPLSIPSVNNGDGTRTWFIRDSIPITSGNRSYLGIGLSLQP